MFNRNNRSNVQKHPSPYFDLAITYIYIFERTFTDDASLEFAPVNLHLQRMWVHNDTLNKTGFHDIITAGAFAAHTHKAERTGGLIR